MLSQDRDERAMPHKQQQDRVGQKGEPLSLAKSGPCAQSLQMPWDLNSRSWSQSDGPWCS